jgi:hypothetical protein
VATTLSNLASVLICQAKYEDAEPLNCRALAIEEAAQGPGYLVMAFTSEDLDFKRIRFLSGADSPKLEKAKHLTIQAQFSPYCLGLLD